MALQQEIEKFQNRPARFVTSNYCFETGRYLYDWNTGKTEMGVSRKGGETVDGFFCTNLSS